MPISKDGKHFFTSVRVQVGVTEFPGNILKENETIQILIVVQVKACLLLHPGPHSRRFHLLHAKSHW